ncbi:hypothetical protein LCGC14_0357070 [marine sediment metagenome]|uniref:Uncharacterized protein n=1 Tax=marine sediment metagenome TaxID=412755 RepID=A0A0F9WH54_9ZZZZ
MTFNEGCWFYMLFCFVILTIMYCEWFVDSFDKWRRLRKLRSLRKWYSHFEEWATVGELRMILWERTEHVYAGYTQDHIGFVCSLWAGSKYIEVRSWDLQDAMRKVARLAYHHLRRR